ncbi:MAG: hypothetical protein GYA24_20370 [Candidatus Lokiarchaeota archaeon]|nr:hypothetical protein [Candidatus Lokiarchaeota archaeon]
MSDKTWHYAEARLDGWPFATMPGSTALARFKPARSFGKPPMAWQGPITVPVWEKGWKSSISFTFGYRNMIESAVPMFAGRKAYQWLFWLFPAVIKLFGSDVYGLRRPRRVA